MVQFICLIGFLQELGQSGKKIYMHYSRTTPDQVITILDNNTYAMKEINNLNGIKPDVPGLTGLFISDFEVDVLSNLLLF